MNLYGNNTVKSVIILFIFSVTNGARQGSKCRKIKNFVGGTVFYQEGNRKVGSQAFYSCSQAFSLFPRNIEFSVCNKALQWEPDPPRCYRKALLQVPDNGYVKDGEKDFLLHLESYTVCCNQGYEIRSDGVNGTQYCKEITNKNGNLKPRVECVEEGCDPDDYWMTVINYKNNSVAKAKIPSRTVVVLSCKDGHGFYRSGLPMQTHHRRTCFKGIIERAPKCQEAKCLFSGYPSTIYTSHRVYLSDAVMVADDQYIEHGEALQVYCYRTDIFELYVNSSKTYPTEFITKCRYGEFDKRKEEFPICLERGCDLNVSNESCFLTNDQANCKPINFTVSSGTTLEMGCKNGYSLYQSDGGLNIEVNGTISVKCRRGSYNSLDMYKCIPDKLLTLLKGQDDRYPVELDRVSCRFSISKPGFCKDPCLIPTIPSGIVKDALTDEILEFETRHNTSITVECDVGYTLSNQMTIKCQNGEFEKDLPACIPTPCKFAVDDNLKVFVNNSSQSIQVGHHIFQNGTIAEILCEQGYKLTDEMSADEIGQRMFSTCLFGNWTRTYRCVPKECYVPQIENALPMDEKVYTHRQEVLITCEDGFHIYQNASTVIRSLVSRCALGKWSSAVPNECQPDGCHLAITSGSVYIDGRNNITVRDTGLQSNGTTLLVRCMEQFDMFDNLYNLVSYNGFNASINCHHGNWDAKYFCRKRCSLPNVTKVIDISTGSNVNYGQTVVHGERINVTCENQSADVVSTKCENGNWQPEVNCIALRNTSLPSFSNENSFTPLVLEVCVLPSNAVIDDSSTDVTDRIEYENGDDINVTCKDQLGGHVVSIKCKNGQWQPEVDCATVNDVSFTSTSSQTTTVAVESTGCVLSSDPRYRYTETDTGRRDIKPRAWIPSGTSLTLTCLEFDPDAIFSDYDSFSIENGTETIDELSSTTVTCIENELSPIQLDCKEVRCILPSNAVIENSRVDVTDRIEYENGENINVTCKDQLGGYVVSIKCKNGQWQPEVNCTSVNDVSFTLTSSQTTTVAIESTGCVLSTDQRYRYTVTDTDRNYTKPGDWIPNGTSLTVTCTEFDPDAILLDYDNFSNENGTETIDESSPITVTCIENELSPFQLDCREVKAENCTVVQHGDLLTEKGFYFVKCHEGFSLNVASSEMPEFKCENGNLKSVLGNREPLCEPDKCIVPYNKDGMLSLTDKYGVSLSGGSTVNSEEIVTFDCSSAKRSTFEPNERNFICLHGRWVEYDTDINWTFGNNFTFPTCRKAQCEPNCQNGGECFKDNACRCINGTKGQRCERIICDAECEENGGECTYSGKCACSIGRTGINCRQALCVLPRNVAKIYGRKENMYSEGQTIENFYCDKGDRLSHQGRMTCMSDGTWSDVIKCIKDVNNPKRYKNCFDYGHRWCPEKPAINRYHITLQTNKKWMSLYECQRLCIEATTPLCVSVVYQKHVGKCEGYSVSDKKFFSLRYGAWNSPVYIRKCF